MCPCQLCEYTGTEDSWLHTNRAMDRQASVLGCTAWHAKCDMSKADLLSFPGKLTQTGSCLSIIERCRLAWPVMVLTTAIASFALVRKCTTVNCCSGLVFC